MVVRLRVGGLTLALRAGRARPGLGLPRESRPFACARGGDLRLRLSAEPVPEPPASDLLFDSGGLWRVHRFGDGLLYSFESASFDPPRYKGVAVDPGLTRGVLYLPPSRGSGRMIGTQTISPGGRGPAGRPGPALDYPLDELLFQHRLAREGAFELHACGLVRDGQAVLFAGRSGAGKSTTARLWRRHRRGTLVLSDDRIVIRPRRGRPWAFGTPWHGQAGFASPLARPLAAVFFLRRSARTRVRRLEAAEAAALLVARSFPPLWEREPLGRVLEACGQVALRTPCYELRCRKDLTAVAAVEQELARLAPARPARARG